MTYFVFFGLGMVLYATVPYAAHLGSTALFVAMFCVILSMYGGGFATVPAYLADIFGTAYVGAIHGRLLTAWSTSGIIGPVVVNYVREAQIAAGVPRAHVYDRTMLILAGMLLLGFIANLMVRPVAERWLMKPGRPVARAREAQRHGPCADRQVRQGLGGLDVRAALRMDRRGHPPELGHLDDTRKGAHPLRWAIQNGGGSNLRPPHCVARVFVSPPTAVRTWVIKNGDQDARITLG